MNVMSTTYLIRVVFLVMVLMVSLLVYAYLQITKKQKQQQEREKIVGGRKKKSANLFKAYKFFSQVKLTQKFLKKWVKVYALRIPGDFKKVREEAMKVSLIMWCVSAGFIIWALLFNLSLYGLSCAGLAAYFVCKTYTISQMEKLDLQIIKELNLFVDDVRHFYFDSKMVEESIKESMKDSPLLLMKQHAQKVYDVVTADDIVEAAKKYNKTIQDYFLRKFMATCVVVEQYGDRTIDDESLFLSSLRDIKQDIQVEMIRRRGISHKFKFLSGISMVPYFLLHVIENFGSDCFSSLADMYHGSFGSICKVILFFGTLICYQVVNRLRETLQVDTENPKFYKWLFSKKPIAAIVKSKLNRNWGKALRLRTLLKKTGNPLNMYLFTLKRMCFFVVGFVATVGFFFGLHVNNKNLHSRNIITAMSTTSGASDEESFQMLIAANHLMLTYKDVDFRRAYNQSSGLAATMSFDSAVSDYASNYFINKMQTESLQISEEEAYECIAPFIEEFDGTTYAIGSLVGHSWEEASSKTDAFLNSGFAAFQNAVRKANEIDFFEQKPELYELIARGAIKKIKRYQNEYFKWYDLLVAFLVGVLCYVEPWAMSLFEKKALQMDMMDEVIQFESVIMILMWMERMTAEEILEWMYMFSRIFRNSLSSCMCMYPLDDLGALDQLIKDEPYEPFRRLVENIKVCDRIGVELAFNGLKSERKNYQEERKQENEISLSSKGAAGEFVAFLPFYGAIGLYMVVPYCVAAVGDLTSSMAEVNQMSQSSS